MSAEEKLLAQLARLVDDAAPAAVADVAAEAWLVARVVLMVQTTKELLAALPFAGAGRLSEEDRRRLREYLTALAYNLER